MISMYLSLPKKIRQVAYLLCMLKPGEYMDLSPAVFDVKAETLQTYVHLINGLYGRRYRAYGGVVRKDGKRLHKPEGHMLRVHYIGLR